MSINLLKILALTCMVVDHIGEFFPQAPMWFRFVGRISAPIFFYCSVWGFYHTSDRKKYLIRLYLMGLLMSLGNITIQIFIPKENLLNNNIFTTLFLGCMIVYLLDRNNKIAEKVKWSILLIVQQVIAFFLCAIFAEFLQIPKYIDTYALYYGYGSLFGSAIFTEGSIWFVVYYVVVYFLKDKRMYLSIFVLSFSVILEVLIQRTYYMRGPVLYLIPFYDFQWLMMLVIPFFWIYNGKKGKGIKWFYYWFYPLHIWLLYILS